jgi:hypothetical protein
MNSYEHTDEQQRIANAMEAVICNDTVKVVILNLDIEENDLEFRLHHIESNAFTYPICWAINDLGLFIAGDKETMDGYITFHINQFNKQ